MQTSNPTEHDYWAEDDKLRIASTELANASAPADRARLLFKLHGAQERQALIHPEVFGPDPMDDEDGRDLAEAHASSAILYGLLADVEQSIAYPGLAGRRNTTTVLERHAGGVLDRMAATPDLAGRMRLLEELIGAVHPVIGGQAVEVLWCLPAPGFSGPLTIEEKDAWLAERGQGTGTETFGRRMDTLAPRLVFAGVVLVTLVGAAILLRALHQGDWPLIVFGAVLVTLVPRSYVRSQSARRRFLAEPTGYDE